MKTIRSLIARLSLALAGLGVTSTQAALEPAIVPSSAQWVAYADFNQMRQTDLGQEIIVRVQEQYAKETKDDPMGNLNVAGLITQVMETIGSITMFGTAITDDPEEMDGTAVIQGTDKMRIISEGLIAHFLLTEPNKIGEISDLPFEAYAIDGQIFVGFPDEPIVLVSRSRDHMVSALNVFRSGAQSLRSAPGALTPMLPQEDSYYMFASSVVPSAEIPDSNEPQARILKMTQSASVMLAEVGDDILARATLVADSEETAQRLGKIVNGVTALLSLAQDSDEDLVQFIESVRVQQNADRVDVQMSYPSIKLVELAQANIEREARQQQRRQEAIEATLNVPGEEIASWQGSRAESESEMQDFLTDPVSLVPGTTIFISAWRRNNDPGRLDYIEIIPVGAEKGEKFEAEYMRLSNYRIQKYDRASGGEMLVVRGGSGRAQMRFGGEAGDYQIRVRYVDNTGGVARYKVSVRDPEME
ncbi:MAG: hypothetical protein SynsKO_39770 [Synoicihabitans sp.]